MSYFMDHYSKHCVFHSLAVCTILFCSSEIETDHWVLHSTAGFHALRNGVGIWNRELAVCFYGMSNSLRRKLAIQSISFLCIIAHAHYFLSFHVHWHRIHHEFA